MEWWEEYEEGEPTCLGYYTPGSQICLRCKWREVCMKRSSSEELCSCC